MIGPSVAEILLQQGRDIAAARQRSADISQQMWGNIGNTIASAPAQYQAAKTAQQNEQMRNYQLQYAQRDLESQTAFENVLKDPANYNPDGTPNTQKISDTLRGQNIGAWEHWNDLATKNQQNLLKTKEMQNNIALSDQSLAEKQRNITKTQQDYLGGLAYHAEQLMDQNPGDPLHARDTVLAAVAHAAAAPNQSGVSEQDAKQFMMQMARASPDQMRQVLGQFVPPDLRAKLDREAAQNAKDTAEAQKALKPQIEKPDTATQEDQRYENVLMARQLGKPVSPDDNAFATAYEKRKKLTVDASASAAADRQATAIDNQNNLQKKAQDFQRLETARKDINEANKTYLTSKQSSQTLREAVQAAQSGNKVAAALQNLETTMGAIRSQGLNRINTAEIGVTANAGSMFDRISGWLGKAAEGQPVPANIQKDILEFADILDKAAYKRYSDSVDSTGKLYDIADKVQALKLSPDAKPETQTQPTVIPVTRGADGKLKIGG